MFQGLTNINFETGQIVPDLADGWEVSENQLQWTFHLREGLQWSDGQSLTADDVLFTYNDVIFNQDIPNSSRDILTVNGQPIRVEKIDEHSLRFILPEPFAPFLRATSAAILPKHILESAVQNKQFLNMWATSTNPDSIICNGPFQLAAYDPGERIILKRNPHYWKKDQEGTSLPYLDEVYIQVLPSPDLALMKFKSGELDVLDVSGRDYPIVKPNEQRLGYRVVDVGPSLSTNFLVFNLNTDSNVPVEPHKIEWFNDDRFRQAIAHAIDKSKMIEIILNGFGSPLNSAMSPAAGFYYNSQIDNITYDLDMARHLLYEMGFSDRNADGILDDANGRELKFTLLTNADNPERLDMAAMIVHDLKQIGMKVNLLSLEFNTLVNKLNSSFDWEAVLLGLTGGIEPHFGANVWVSSGHLHLWHPRQKKAVRKWEKQLDNIFIEGAKQFDEHIRKKLYDQWQEVVAEYLPVIYTVTPHVIVAIRNKVQNCHPTTLGGTFYNIDEIYLTSDT